MFGCGVDLPGDVKDIVADFIVPSVILAAGAAEGVGTVGILGAVAQAATDRLKGETGPRRRRVADM